MRIERFDPNADGGRLQACFELYEAARQHDDPAGPPYSRPAFTGWWGTGFSADPRQAWLASEATGPVGCYLLELPGWENTRLGDVTLIVDPAARRRGLGTALLAHCCEQAREAGRGRVTAEVLQDGPGDAFARAAGGTAGLTEVRRILPADDGLPERLARLRGEAETKAGGYELLTWAGLTPPEFRDQVAAVSQAMNDAPREDSIEPERWDADRVRIVEEMPVKHGLRLYSAAARYPATGELAALTQLLFDPQTPEWGFQLLTAVIRPHRGHRLGLLVKAVTHQWLTEAEPAVRRVVTSNSETNQHMIAINEAIGYRPTARLRSWELSIPEYLAGGRDSYASSAS